MFFKDVCGVRDPRQAGRRQMFRDVWFPDDGMEKSQYFRMCNQPANRHLLMSARQKDRCSSMGQAESGWRHEVECEAIFRAATQATAV